MARTVRHRRRRAVIVTVLCLAVAGGGTAAVVARKPDAKAATTAPSIFKTAAITRGDLTTTESVDGTLQLSSTLTVLHRIEGQTGSSATPAASTNAQTGTGSADATVSSVPAVATNALIDCTSMTVPATPTEPEPTTTTTTTTTTTAVPDPSSTTTVADTAPSSTVATAPTTTVPLTVPPSTAPATPSTEPCDTTTTTVPTVTPTAPAAGPSLGGRTPASATSGASGGGSTTAARITQTITSVVAAGTTINRGDILYTVDGAPVVALDGALPAWRSLSTSSDDGADVAQLEASLVALGYDPEQKVTVDDHFDSATRTMVKAWQEGLGIEATGTVTLGSVVFLPSAATVDSVDKAVGDTVGDGDAVLTLAAPTQEVLIDVPSGDEARVVPGMAVKIGSVAGTVTRLRSANRNGSVVVEAVISPDEAVQASGNGSSVKVTLTIEGNANVLIAPAEALVSRLDGTYAVQVQEADDSKQWVTVELLGVSGGNVAIRGDGLDEGTTLLLPA